MSIKRNLLLATAGAVACLAASAAMAGGPDHVQAAGFNPYVYGELDLGYAYSDWGTYTANVGNGIGAAGTVVNGNRRGGFTVGGEIGYAPIRYISAVAGGFYLPRVTSTAAGTGINNWFIYAGPRINAPIWNGVSVFAEGGVAYRALGGTNGAPNGDYWTPVYGAGLQYDINESFYLAAKWMRVPGHSNVTRLGDRAPSTDLFLGAGGYKFMV
ncbi:MAG: hypothetical protein K0U12_04425 [Gammaproteobacteria bacterium]|nr:hypothetical protein [Gammaproteobacteria bacterium]